MLARLLRRVLLVHCLLAAALAGALRGATAEGLVLGCVLALALPFASTVLAIAYTAVVSRPGESEPESFLPVPERRVKTPRTETQSTAIAQAMARICNDEPGCFGVQGGHRQKTLRLSLRAWWRALLGEAWAACVVFLLRQPWSWSPPAVQAACGTGPQRIAVVLVHGYLCNHRLWDTVARALTARGHAVLAVNLEPVFTSIDHYAATVEDAVQQLRRHTGQRQVALVGHSMGGLAIRAWLRQYGMATAARAITLGTPHAGTQVPQHLPTPNGRQMAWHSPWLAALQASESPAQHALFETALSAHDNIVYPQRAQVLPGVPATVFEGMGHLQMCLHPAVIAWLVQKLDAVDASTP